MKLKKKFLFFFNANRLKVILISLLLVSFFTLNSVQNLS